MVGRSIGTPQFGRRDDRLIRRLVSDRGRTPQDFVLLAINARPDPSCAGVDGKAQAGIGEIDHRMAYLITLSAELQRAIDGSLRVAPSLGRPADWLRYVG